MKRIFGKKGNAGLLKRGKRKTTKSAGAERRERGKRLWVECENKADKKQRATEGGGKNFK